MGGCQPSNEGFAEGVMRATVEASNERGGY